MLQDLLPFLKEPYISIFIAVQWIALGAFFMIDQSLDIVLMLGSTMIASLIMIWKLASQKR